MPPTGQSQPDLSHLDDSELSQMLKSYGIDVGPINAATRRTYERRLAKLQTEEESASHFQEVSDVDQSQVEETTESVEHFTYTSDVATSPYHQSEDESEKTKKAVAKEKYKETVVKAAAITTTPSQHLPERCEQVVTKEKYEEKLKPVERSVKPATVTTPSRHWPEIGDKEIKITHPEFSSTPASVLSRFSQPMASSVKEREFSTRIESRPSLPLNRRTPTTYTAPSRHVPTTTTLPQQKKKKGYPLWLVLLTVAVVVILSYLIYVNMEPAAKSNIPGVANKIEV